MVMKPLIVLLTSFILTVIVSRVVCHVWSATFAGNLAMCMMLFLTAFGHFRFTKGMVMMMSPYIPARTFLVYFTGIAEVLFGVALLFPQSRSTTGVALIAFFILLLPANIYAALSRINMEKADYTGPGPAYLWFRVPLQLLFIVWVRFFSL
jgi:uncharacterized membrane protein